jgi:predicted nucleic acid-binding protein
VALYLDTSALVKLYIAEDDRESTLMAVQASDVVIISVVGYAEARAALARRHREGRINEEEHRLAVVDLTQDWQTFLQFDVSGSIAIHAGELADRHALRGFDAIHLATALRAGEIAGGLTFLAFDARLNAAAQGAGLPVFGVDSN